MSASAAPYAVLSTVPDYAHAQSTVDRLSDAGFPVEHVRIVGQVTGRLTTGAVGVC